VNSGHLANPVSQSLIVASGALLQWTLPSLATRGTTMKTKTKNHQQNPKNTNEQQIFLEARNGNISSKGKLSTSKAEEDYCIEETQSGPLTHSQSHQAQNTAEYTEVKHRRAWTKEEIREVIWCYMYCRQHFTDNYKKVYEIWRQCNPECRMYMDAKKLMNQKNYIMKHKKITEIEVEEIKKELQKSQPSHLEEREQLEQLGTIGEDEQKLNATTTTEEEVEIHQQRNQIHKLKEKIESTYYQIIQIEIDKQPTLQKLQNMVKIKAIMKMANEAMEEILDGKDLSVTELNHLIYAAATVITEEINGTGEYKLETQRSKTPAWVRRIQKSINNTRKELSALVEVKRDNRKAQNIKRIRLLKKYNIEQKENLDQLIEELKQKVSAKAQ
jgi:hypothetical protein